MISVFTIPADIENYLFSFINESYYGILRMINREWRQRFRNYNITINTLRNCIKDDYYNLLKYISTMRKITYPSTIRLAFKFNRHDIINYLYSIDSSTIFYNEKYDIESYNLYSYKKSMKTISIESFELLMKYNPKIINDEIYLSLLLYGKLDILNKWFAKYEFTKYDAVSITNKETYNWVKNNTGYNIYIKINKKTKQKDLENLGSKIIKNYYVQIVRFALRCNNKEIVNWLIKSNCLLDKWSLFWMSSKYEYYEYLKLRKCNNIEENKIFAIKQFYREELEKIPNLTLNEIFRNFNYNTTIWFFKKNEISLIDIYSYISKNICECETGIYKAITKTYFKTYKLINITKEEFIKQLQYNIWLENTLKQMKKNYNIETLM